MPEVSIIMPAKIRSSNELNWVMEAIQSVYAQKFDDWELVFINDHSTIDLDPLKQFLTDNVDNRFRGYKAVGKGVVDARNQAAEASRGRFLLPLDADDLLPPSSVLNLLDGWTGEGIVYGNTILFGQDFRKVFQSRPYSFSRLLRELIMPVGSLHLKADWEKVGGWSSEMENGLEDWEYWIRMGAAGVCGHHIPHVTYHYRRRTEGRLRTMKRKPKKYQKAYAKMRQIHSELYNGRRPVACCSDHSIKPHISKPSTKKNKKVSKPTGDMWKIEYTGARKARFGTRGAVTNQPYIIPGRGKLITTKNGTPEVDPRDGAVMVQQQPKSFRRVQ